MGKLISLILGMVVSISLFAQQPSICFQGIPVNGSKQEVRKLLVEQGFDYNWFGGYFSGEVDGKESKIVLLSEKNTVQTIGVVREVEKGIIADTYNNTIDKFLHDENYLFVSGGKIEKKDIDGYRIVAYPELYSTVFHQKIYIDGQIDWKATRKNIVGISIRKLKDCYYLTVIYLQR